MSRPWFLSGVAASAASAGVSVYLLLSGDTTYGIAGIFSAVTFALFVGYERGREPKRLS